MPSQEHVVGIEIGGTFTNSIEHHDGELTPLGRFGPGCGTALEATAVRREA